MLSELSNRGVVTGVKQVRRALAAGRARELYLASDADPALVEPLAALAREKGLAVHRDATMKDLGRSCGIAVGAAAAAVV